MSAVFQTILYANFTECTFKVYGWKYVYTCKSLSINLSLEHLRVKMLCNTISV